MKAADRRHSSPRTRRETRARPTRSRQRPVAWVVYRSEAGFVADFEQCLRRGGLFVNSRRIPRVGARVRVGLELPRGSTPLYVDGRVSWVSPFDNEQNEPPGFFVSFLHLDPAIWDRLHRAAVRAGADVRRRARRRTDQPGACETRRRATPRSIPPGLPWSAPESTS